MDDVTVSENVLPLFFAVCTDVYHITVYLSSLCMESCNWTTVLSAIIDSSLFGLTTGNVSSSLSFSSPTPTWSNFRKGQGQSFAIFP